MEKSRKKQRTMAIVAIVLMVCLVLALGTLTFAKYITSENVTKAATVTTWGYTISVNADNLLGKDYTKVSGDYATVANEGTGVAVKAADLTLAPGTSGSMTITIQGGSQSAAKLSFSGTVTSQICFGQSYYPVVWTLSGSDIENPITSTDLNDLITEVNKASSTKLPADSKDIDNTYTLSWVWNEHDTDEHDAFDTIIGYKAEKKEYEDIKDIKSRDYVLGELIDSQKYNNVSYLCCALIFDLTVSIEQVQG